MFDRNTEYLQDIAVSLRILAGRGKKPEGVADQPEVPVFTSTPAERASSGPQRLSEPLSTPEGDWEAYKAYERSYAYWKGAPAPLTYAAWRTEQQAKRLAEGVSQIGMEYNPRLVEKLLNPEGH